MGDIVIRTRYDEGTESAEVATSAVFTDERRNSDLDRQSAYDIGKMTMI
jgi:hypothetical protein